MKIAVYEHLSSGGYAGRPISPTFLSEGFGMLRTFASDLKTAGHEVTVLLDDRISKLNPPMNVDYIVPILNSQEPKKFLINLAKINDASYIIAPEKGKTLQSLVKLIEDTGKISLNSKSSAIQNVADKAVLYEVLKENDLSSPETIILDVSDSLSDIKRNIKRKLSYPLIFKPVVGVSCNGLSIVEDEDQIEKAIDKIRAESADKHFIIQEFVEGDAVSVSVICARYKASAISLNKQTVKVGAPADNSTYEGGIVPFDHPLKKQALTLAEKVVKRFPGLSGYVGVDLILAKDNAFVVEVNPRLTTSYIGLSKAVNFNVGQSSVSAVLENKLPTGYENRSYVGFSKLETSKPTLSTFHKVANISEVVSPPFTFVDNPKTCSIVACQADSVKDVELRLEETKKRLLTIISRGK